MFSSSTPRRSPWVGPACVAGLITLLLASFAVADQVRVYPGQYVVQIRDVGARTTSAALRLSGVEAVTPLGRGAFQLKAGGISARRRLRPVRFDPRDTFCKELSNRLPGLRSCSPDFEVRIGANASDPSQGSLWGFSAQNGIDAPRAWNRSTGSRAVVIAIIDTGVDYTHPDLAANMWRNPGEIPGNGIDDDNNGYVDDVHGINAITSSGNPMDDHNHGTHCAGTIGAVANNGIGVAGVNWETSIMALKFLGAGGGGSVSSAIRAINYMNMMKDRGVNVRVSSNSWGGGGFSQALSDAIEAAKARGIIFVAAAGNDTNDNDGVPSYPASYDVDTVVSVAALDQSQNLASFSNFGATSVDIAAPGTSILSTVRGGSYGIMSGTSMATPHVSGALALLFSSEPSLSAQQAISRLYESGRTLSTLNGVVRTSRTLDVARLLHNENAPIPAPIETPSCSYTMESVPYVPDYAADYQPISLQADDTPFQRVDLPFAFPFDGSTASFVTVSPNGVLYIGHSGTLGDYQNRSKAPSRSIAALHTDMYAGFGEEGVRYALGADRATFLWRARHFGKRDGGSVEVRLTLYADGSVADFVSFSDSAMESWVQARATIGISGAQNQSAATYGYNSTAIRHTTGVRFTPTCTAPPSESAVVTGIEIQTQARAKKVVPGRAFSVLLRGTGVGAKTVQAKLNGRMCNDQATVDFNSGARFRAILSKKVAKSFKRLEFVSDGVSSSVLIKGTPSSRSSKRVARTAACRSLIRSVRQSG